MCIISIVDYAIVIYLGVFEIASIAAGLITLRACEIKLGRLVVCREPSFGRNVLAFTVYGVAWLGLIWLCMQLFSHIVIKISHDQFLLLAILSLCAWFGSMAYWSLLLTMAEGTLQMPTNTARTAASNTLLWNLLLTLPYIFLAKEYLLS